jgi:hypothetical protein
MLVSSYQVIRFHSILDGTTNELRVLKSTSEPYRRLLAKLVPNLVDRRRRVVSATDPHGRILGVLDRSRYFFFKVARQLYS